MTKILLAYHSHDGQTTKIAGHLALRLRELGLEVDGVEARHAPRPDGYDVVVVGDSIRLGRHSRALTRYLRRHREALEQLPVALFQVSMTSAGHDAEHVAEAERLLARLVDRTGLQPRRRASFAGALRYSEYGWVTQRVMRSIARREGNATDMTRDHEYTDWEEVDAFAAEVASLAPAKEQRSEAS
jgi:menaquinone-dependent protoporphyrinogen oxidase